MNGQETEVKFYVRDLAGLEQRLLSLGARLIRPRTHEVNLRFDTASGDLRREGRVLRLRQDDQPRLTYKDGSELIDGALSRREIEFTVGDFETARGFLEALEYEVMFSYEKFRTTYALGEGHVMLDEMPYGDFVEIEGNMGSLRPLTERLALNWDAAIPASYHALFERARAALKLESQDLSFLNFEEIVVAPAHLGVRPADEERSPSIPLRGTGGLRAKSKGAWFPNGRKGYRRHMTYKKIPMEHDKKIALVAHDNKKRDLVEWAKYNRDLLAHHKIYATGTTGEILEQELGFEITKLQSGPLGGDQQIGAKIVDGELDFLIFFWDPLEPLPHDPDVKALLRMAVVWNIPIACNRASADFMISSPLMEGGYVRLVPDYEAYQARKIPGSKRASQDARGPSGDSA